MMDPARAAEMSDPGKNRLFIHTWDEPPPLNRKRRGGQAPASPEKQRNPNVKTYTSSADIAQRAVTFALRPAARLDSMTDLLLFIGQPAAARRLSRVAAGLREAVQ